MLVKKVSSLFASSLKHTVLFFLSSHPQGEGDKHCGYCSCRSHTKEGSTEQSQQSCHNDAALVSDDGLQTLTELKKQFHKNE